ncbi:MAG: TolC family protein [Saprospiraceae bacterium]|nr:TolC family protein [Saprospiraceae bacterium]
MKHFISQFTFLLLGVLGSTTGISAQEVLTLDQCVRIALEKDLQRQIAGLQLEITDINNHGAVAGRYPNVSINTFSQGNLNDQDNPASFLNGLIRSGNTNISLDATWLVFDGFRVKYNLKRLGALEEQARARLDQAGIQTVRQTTLAYLQVEWLQEQVDLAREVLQLSEGLLEDQLLRREYGQALTQQVLQSKDAVLADSAGLGMAILNRFLAQHALNLAMGDPDRPEFIVTGALTMPTQVWEKAILRQTMLAQNPQIQEAVLGEQIASHQTRITRADFSPRFVVSTGAVLSGSITEVDGNNPFTGEPFGTQIGSNRNLYFGVSGSWPIFDAGIRRREVSVNRLQERIAHMNRQALTDQLLSQLDDLLVGYTALLQNLSIQEEQVENARQNLSMAEDKFRLGQLSIFDVRTVQLSYAQATLRRITTVYQLRVHEVEILSLTGLLSR